MQLFWTISRIITLLGGIPVVLLLSTETPAVDWRLSVIFALTGSIGLFVWLSMIRYDSNIDWSNPYSWDTPFFPQTKYPLRNWLVTSYSALIAGVTGLLMSIWSSHINASLSAMFLTVGICLLVSLHIWMKLFLNRSD